MLAEQLRVAREGLELDRRRHRQALHDERRDAEKRLALAKEYVEAVGFDRALQRLIEETWHWGAWLKRPDAARYTAVAIPGLRAASRKFAKVGDTKMLWVPMPSGVHRLRFSIEPYSSFSEGYSFGTVSWAVDGRPVFRGRISQSPGGTEYARGWRLTQVQRFDIGPWLVDALEVDHRIEKNRVARQEAAYTKHAQKNAQALPPVDELEALLKEAKAKK